MMNWVLFLIKTTNGSLLHFTLASLADARRLTVLDQRAVGQDWRLILR
jgi:hypothetical protein